MRKQSKRPKLMLQLDKETIKLLSAPENVVAGAAQTWSFPIGNCTNKSYFESRCGC